MADNFQTIQSGKAELKDYYGNESTYEAIRRRRKKSIEKLGIEEEIDEDSRQEVPDPQK